MHMVISITFTLIATIVNWSKLKPVQRVL